MITLARVSDFAKFLCSAGITLAFYYHEFSFLDSDLKTLATALAGSAGSILGFLITAIALMAAVMDKALLINLRATGGYAVLIKRSFACAALHLALLALSICLLLPWSGDKRWLLLATVFCSCMCATYLASAGYSFYRVIMALSRKQ